MLASGVAPSPSRFKAVVPERPSAQGRRKGPAWRMPRERERGERRTRSTTEDTVFCMTTPRLDLFQTVIGSCTFSQR
jgi:hypothetical protein